MKKLFILYLGTLCSLSIFSYFFVDPNLTYFKVLFTNIAFQYRGFVTVTYIVFLVILFGLYFAIVQKLKHIPQEIKWLKKYIGVAVVILLFSYPAMLSFDIFNYIFTAKVLFFYHENPYIVMPIAFLGDPLLAFTHAANKIALYGPFWILLSGIPFILGLGNFVVTLFALKGFIAAWYIASLWVMWQLTKRVEAVALFALNPLVIVETLVSGHNDIVMVFLTLLAVLFMKKRQLLLALLFFLLAALIKYAVIILTPVFIYTAWSQFLHRHINWENVYFISAILLFLFMIIAAPIREEIYPWYAIWFLSFVSLFTHKKVFMQFSIVFSFALMLRYIPYMYLATYSFPTSIIKILVTFVPFALFFLYIFIKRFLWPKN